MKFTENIYLVGYNFILPFEGKLSSKPPPKICETGQIWGLCAFSWERMKRMAWHLTCWCMQTIFKTGHILIMVCWFPHFGAILTLWDGDIWGFRAFSGECMEKITLNLADVSWLHSALIRVWSRSIYFRHFGAFLLQTETGQVWGLHTILGERLEGTAWNLACCSILTTFRSDWILQFGKFGKGWINSSALYNGCNELSILGV